VPSRRAEYLRADLDRLWRRWRFQRSRHEIVEPLWQALAFLTCDHPIAEPRSRQGRGGGTSLGLKLHETASPFARSWDSFSTSILLYDALESPSDTCFAGRGSVS